MTALREREISEADTDRRMYQRWGWYQLDDIRKRFHVNQITVTSGGRLTLHKHYHQTEHRAMVIGTAEVMLSKQVFLVHENESVNRLSKSMHRLTDQNKMSLEMIEAADQLLCRRGQYD